MNIKTFDSSSPQDEDSRPSKNSKEKTSLGLMDISVPASDNYLEQQLKEL